MRKKSKNTFLASNIKNFLKSCFNIFTNFKNLLKAVYARFLMSSHFLEYNIWFYFKQKKKKLS